MSDADNSNNGPPRAGLLAQIKNWARGSSDLSDPRFNRFLECMNRVETLKHEEILAELEHNYALWAHQFTLLKTQFESVWELFGKIEGEVEGWYRASPHGGEWGYMGLCREGYHFGAAIERNYRRAAPYASKWVSVTFAVGNSGRNGISDERCLGRTGGMDNCLVGLEACSGQDIKQQLLASRVMLDVLNRYRLVFGLHNDEIGQRTSKVELNILEQHSLKALCEQLFMGLNNDALHALEAQLPFQQQLLVGNR